MTARGLMTYIGSILDEMQVFGDTEECVDYVIEHDDGRLEKRFAAELFRVGLADEVRRVIRYRRLPESRNVPAHPSIEVETGEVDENGEPIMARKFTSMKQLLLSNDWVAMDKVVDAQVKRARSGMSIANATVKVARLRGFQRELPFPEQDTDDGAA